MKRLLVLLLFISIFQLEGASADSRSWTVLVTVPPHKYFVEQIAGDAVEVKSLVPPGANSHSYSPTPKQMISASHADLYFQIGEPFEARVFPALRSHNRRIQEVDLRRGLDLITGGHAHQKHGCHHCQGGVDVHFWMSPKEAKVQAQTIGDALMKQYPEKSRLFSENLEILLENLDDLDVVIREIMSKAKSNVIMVSHPAFSYFARDYDITQISIEFEGKDPTPKQLNQILEAAEKYQIDRIFIQEQYTNKAATLVADKIGAELILVDPYSEKYISNMRTLALRFSGK